MKLLTKCFINLFLLFALASSALAVLEEPMVSAVHFSGTLDGELACTLNCGNCCTGQMVTEQNNGFTAVINDLDDSFAQFLSDSETHQVEGYFYQGAGSCGMNMCTFFKVTGIDSDQIDIDSVVPKYASETQRLELPLLYVNKSRYYKVSLDAPYNIVDITKIMKQGESCAIDEEQRECDTGLDCLSYFGIAGGSGPEFFSCEIACESDSNCSNDQQCITIADGPGQVCR